MATSTGAGGSEGVHEKERRRNPSWQGKRRIGSRSLGKEPVERKSRGGCPFKLRWRRGREGVLDIHRGIPAAQKTGSRKTQEARREGCRRTSVIVEQEEGLGNGKLGGEVLVSGQSRRAYHGKRKKIKTNNLKGKKRLLLSGKIRIDPSGKEKCKSPRSVAEGTLRGRIKYRPVLKPIPRFSWERLTGPFLQRGQTSKRPSGTSS